MKNDYHKLHSTFDIKCFISFIQFSFVIYKFWVTNIDTHFFQFFTSLTLGLRKYIENSTTFPKISSIKTFDRNKKFNAFLIQSLIFCFFAHPGSIVQNFVTER